MPIRWPAVAGQFYERDAQSLKKSINECFIHRLGPGRKPPPDRPFEGIIGLVSPHAGYMYSGPIAAHGYYACSTLSDLELVVILGPNHHGIGSGVATVNAGSWRTPLGDVEVDGEAARELVKRSGIVDFNEIAHQAEHSIEVQIPFLQYIYSNKFKILPICMLMQDQDTAIEVGEALAIIAKRRRSLLIASSDFTHYESQRSALSKDQAVIEAILKLDVDLLYETIKRLNVSACGFGPIASVMTASKSLGGQECKLLKYANSGDVTGDHSVVVGYASILFSSR